MKLRYFFGCAVSNKRLALLHISFIFFYYYFGVNSIEQSKSILGQLNKKKILNLTRKILDQYIWWWLIDWLIDWLFNRLIDWLIDCSMDGWIDWLIGWLILRWIDWLIDWFFFYTLAPFDYFFSYFRLILYPPAILPRSQNWKKTRSFDSEGKLMMVWGRRWGFFQKFTFCPFFLSLLKRSREGFDPHREHLKLIKS